MYDVSVIVSVHADERLERLLRSLDEQTLPRSSFEVLVVENGSATLRAVCERYGARYFHLDSASMPAARNVGLKNANGRILAFTDVDCICSPEWLTELSRAFSEPDIAAVGGAIHDFTSGTAVQMYASNIVNGQTRLNYLPILDVPYVVTANCAFRHDKVLEVGGFDESLRSGNDVDICYRLGLNGGRVELCPSAIIYHQNRPTLKSHWRRFFNYAMYQALLFKKYRRASAKYFVINTYPAQCVARAVKIVLSPSSWSSGWQRPIWTAALLIVEGLAVLSGDLYGSAKFRTLYL